MAALDLAHAAFGDDSSPFDAFPKSRKPKRVRISDMATGKMQVILDASVQERHTHTNDVTDFPVEQGANVTDHVRPRSRPLMIEGVLSDFQMGSGRGRGAAASVRYQVLGADISDDAMALAGKFGLAIPAQLDPLVPPTIDISPGSDGRDLDDAANLLYAQLEDFADKGTLLKVETAFRPYENMVIEDLDAPRDASTMRAVRFTIRLKQIRLVSSETAAVKASKVAPSKLGKQTPAPASDAEQAKSWAVQSMQSDFLKDHPWARAFIPDSAYQSFQSSSMNPLVNQVVK